MIIISNFNILNYTILFIFTVNLVSLFNSAPDPSWTTTIFHIPSFNESSGEVGEKTNVWGPKHTVWGLDFLEILLVSNSIGGYLELISWNWNVIPFVWLAKVIVKDKYISNITSETACWLLLKSI